MRILAVTGASGGHIYPALAFLSSFQGEGRKADTLLVLPSRSIKIALKGHEVKAVYISSGKVQFSLTSKNILAFLKFLRGAWQSLLIFLKFRPDVVVGFGSIDSIPLILLGWFFRAKTVIHEQNVLPGKANRFLSRFVDRVAISFKESAGFFNLSGDKLVLTGNPIRSTLKKIEKKKALDFFGFNENKFTILVMGGSQGSRSINTAFINSLKTLEDKSGIQIIHLLGDMDVSLISEAYQKYGIQNKLFNFLSSMEFAYSAADLVVTRAGASTISELIYFRLPSIILPYPYARAHQLENAKILAGKGCSIIIDEGLVVQGSLSTTLSSLISNRIKLYEMVSGFGGFPDFPAAQRLKEEIFSLC